MSTVCAIIIIALSAVWLIIKEFPVMLGVVVSTGSIKRIYLKTIVIVFMAAAMLLPLSTDFVVRLSEPYGLVDVDDIVAVAAAAFLAVWLLDRVKIVPSFCCALIGALECYRVAGPGAATFDYALMGSWLAAPVVSMLLACILYLIYKAVFGRAHIHFIKLSGYMRYAVIAGAALLAIALGINNGALLGMVARSLIQASTIVTWLPAVVLVVSMICMNGILRRRTDVCADKYFDFSVQSVVAVSYAVAITLLLFSLDGFCAVLALKAAPQSISALVFGALVGVGVAQRRQTLETDVIYRTVGGLILSPVTAIICFYLLSALFRNSAVGYSDGFDLSIVAVTLLLAVTAVFISYIRRQQHIRQATDKLLFSQQQQLYENQKAMNDMELKTILAENQSLHGTLELKRKEIINVALGISEQKEFLETLSNKVKRAAQSTDNSEKDRLIGEIESELGQRTSFSGEIDEFYTQAEILHKDFSVKLTEEFPDLTNQERRLATLLRLGFSSKYIATLMNISPKSVEISRYRLRLKLGLKRGDNLINFIKSI